MKEKINFKKSKKSNVICNWLEPISNTVYSTLKIVVCLKAKPGILSIIFNVVIIDC